MFINNDDIGKTSMTGWFYDFEIICEYQSIEFTYSMNRIVVKKILNDIILLLIVILRIKMYNNPVVSQILNRYKSAW